MEGEPREEGALAAPPGEGEGEEGVLGVSEGEVVVLGVGECEGVPEGCGAAAAHKGLQHSRLAKKESPLVKLTALFRGQRY